MTRGLPILNYHAFDRSGGLISTAPERLAGTLDRLIGAGWRGVNLGEWIDGGRPRVDRGFAVTIDDGLASILDVADMFSSRGIPATIFLVTGRMGRDNAWPGQPRGVDPMPVMGWPDARALLAEGFDFGAHSRTHRRLDRLAPEGLEAELRGSREDVESSLGVACPLLAYPYGLGPTRVRREAARHFEAGFTASPGEALSTENLYALSRLDSHDIGNEKQVDALISGMSHWALRRLARGLRMRARLSGVGGGRGRA